MTWSAGCVDRQDQVKKCEEKREIGEGEVVREGEVSCSVMTRQWHLCDVTGEVKVEGETPVEDEECC